VLLVVISSKMCLALHVFSASVRNAGTAGWLMLYSSCNHHTRQVCLTLPPCCVLLPQPGLSVLQHLRAGCEAAQKQFNTR
jgi:hypothetical protein